MDRHTIRLALCLREAVIAQAERTLGARAKPDWRIGELMDQYEGHCRRAEKAQKRGWAEAAEHYAASAHRVLQELLGQVQLLIEAGAPRRAIVPGLSDFVRDIEQIEQEFGGYEYPAKEHCLSVSTESIELEGVELGAFRICLDIKKPEKDGLRYTIEALNPYPAEGRDDVVHPHVSDSKLCAGEAVESIDTALAEGRFCDFFMLVRSVLRTYNGRSAYVRLEDWSGTACEDCALMMSDGESYYCEHCDHDYCESCSSSCQVCDGTCCRSCLGTCSECETQACPTCMEHCDQCGAAVCKECIEGDLCPNCHKKEKQDENANEAQAPVVAG